MDIKDKKILVTGGAGFIGSHTTAALIEKGAKVVIVDNLVTGRKENVNPEAKFYEMNIADPKLEEVFEKEKPEIIYHFAFNVLVPKSVENPLVDMDSIVGSVNLLNNAKKYKVKKIVFASSSFIYGNKEKLPIKETDSFEPVSPYVIAKMAVENYLQFFKEGYNLPYVVLRYATVYGPGQVKGAMADYVRKLKEGNQAEIWGDGEKTRDYIYVGDVVRANLSALEVPDSFPDPVFNVGTAVETTLNGLYKEIARLLGKTPEPIYHPDRPGELMKYCLDFSKINNVLGWKPEFDLASGLKKKLQTEKLI